MSTERLEPKDFAVHLKKGLTGGFLFFGEEGYLKHHYLQLTRKELITDPSMAAFSHIRLEESRATPAELTNAILTPTLFSDKKLIEVHGVAWDNMSEETFSEWKDAFALVKEESDTVCICYADTEELDGGTDRAPSKRLLSFSECLTPVCFARQNDRQLCRWIFRHFQVASIEASSLVCEELLTYCGKDMYALSNEVEKLIAYLSFANRTVLESTDIPRVCCRQTEEDAFAFTNAILDGSTANAFALLAEKKARKEKAELILGSISRVCCDLAKIRLLSDCGVSATEIATRMKMHAYRLSLYQKQALRRSALQLERAVLYCEKADLALKNLTGDPYILIERLIVQIGQKKG